MNILILSTIIALFCHGLLISSGKNMIFEPIKKWLDSIFIKTVTVPTGGSLGGTKTEQVVSKWYYPILYCHKCMPSLWGTAICMYYSLKYNNLDLFEYILVLACAVTISTIVGTMYER